MSCAARRCLSLSLGIGLVLVLGCRDAPAAASKPAAVAPPVDTPPEPPDIAWATHVGQPTTASALQPSEAALESVRTVLPSIMTDQAYDSDEIVSARHLVYRVSFVVPPALRGRRPDLLPPAGELHVDVSMERLHARFVGPGWPLEEGTEVRLRGDVPGAYLFDGAGGRPLAPGQLASWFQGHETGRAKSYVYIRRELGLHDSGPGELMCALLAEWSGQPREEIAPRCQGGAMPPAFRLGLWTAELTAIVPIKVARRTLRADSGQPPAPIEHVHGRSMLEASDLARLEPLRLRPEAARAAAQAEVDDSLERDTVSVDNRTDARVIIVAQGIPIAWVAEHERIVLRGLSPGHYRVGAVRPLGQPAMTPTLFRVPGALRFGKADKR